MANARWRLFCLWLSQAARVLADWCLRIFIVLTLAGGGARESQYAWHLVTAVTMAPAVLLAPLNGAIANSLAKPLVLVGSAVLCLAAVTVSALTDGPWLACWAVVAVGAALYGPTRYALLPAAAQDARVPLTRVNAFVETSVFIAVVAGIFLAIQHLRDFWYGLPAVVALAAALNLFAVIAALPVRFASDVRRPEPAARAVRDFFGDGRRIWRDRETRASLVGLASLRAVIAGMTGAIVALTSPGAPLQLSNLLPLLTWVLGGVAAGSLLVGIQRHPRRALALVPLGASGLTLGLFLSAGRVFPGPALCFTLGVMAGLINVPLASAYQQALPDDARGNGMAIRNFADYVLTAVIALVLYLLTTFQAWDGAAQLWLLAAVTALLALAAWRVFLREVLEQTMEILLLPVYRIHGHGPGLNTMPLRGPVIVVANHSAWFDPMWLAKVLPRRLIPMMTSVFYDLPVISWLMVNVAHAIRVEVSGFRRDVPELKEAVAALDRGECVVVFPEGGMRRRDDRPLKQFGQGVWHILRERPNIPVVVCWIEGGWGCYFSYFNGPPTKNKKMDFWRHIDIAVSDPQVLDASTLAEHRTTRRYLMKECLAARRYLGLATDVAISEEVDSEPSPAQEK